MTETRITRVTIIVSIATIVLSTVAVTIDLVILLTR